MYIGWTVGSLLARMRMCVPCCLWHAAPRVGRGTMFPTLAMRMSLQCYDACLDIGN